MLPSFNETIYWAIVVFIVYLLIYAIVDRICKCCEECARLNTLGKFINSKQIPAGMKVEDILKNGTV